MILIGGYLGDESLLLTDRCGSRSATKPPVMLLVFSMTFAPTRERISLCPPDVAGDEILGLAVGTKDDVDNDLVEGSNFFAVVLFLNLSRSGSLGSAKKNVIRFMMLVIYKVSNHRGCDSISYHQSKAFKSQNFSFSISTASPESRFRFSRISWVKNVTNLTYRKGT